MSPGFCLIFVSFLRNPATHPLATYPIAATNGVSVALDSMGALHGYGIARRIEQTSGNLLSLNYGTLYPALLKLEQEGYIASEWGFSDNNRKAKFYKLTRAGRKQLEREAQDWVQTTAILARFLSPEGERT